MSKAKCSSCSVDLKGKATNSIGKNIYCEDCYPVARAEEDERRHLIAVICDVFNLKTPNGMMFSQMKNFREGGMTYKVMRMTLQYLDKVERFNFEVKYGIGIIRVKYQDMINYYNKMAKKRKEVEAVEYKSTEYSIEFKDRENKILKNKLINLDDILGGDTLE